MTFENKLKKKLINREKALGCWTSLDNEITSEMLAKVNLLFLFDFILVIFVI